MATTYSRAQGRHKAGPNPFPGFSLAGAALLIAALGFLLALVPASALANGGQTYYVNKYGPGESNTPGCATAPYTEIGTVWPAPSDAVGDAANGDTIFICGSPDAASEPVGPTSGPYNPAVALEDKDLTFVGDGPALTIIDGQNSRSPFYAGQAGAYVNFESMTIKRGLDVNSGGAVEAICRDVNVTNTHFIDNNDIGFGIGGGAIHAYGDGSCPAQGDASVTNSTFSDNDAESGGARGGAILASGTVTVENSNFVGNQATSTTGGGGGGAIWAGRGFAVSGSTFDSNSVVGPDTYAGAIHGQLGSTATIDRSTFTANKANSAGAFGGAVRTFGTALQVTNTTLTGNQAPDSAALSSSDDVTLKSVTSSGNLSPDPANSPYYVIATLGALNIGNSIINETGESCVAAGDKTDLGGNVIANTTASTGDCLPFVGTGGGPASRVAPSAIDLQPLAENGGPTRTMALGLTSVGRNTAAVNLVGASPKDQRGFLRPLTNQSSGAYQLTGPASTAIPGISGTAQVKQTLSSSSGSWTVSPPVTGYSYQWQRCEVSASPSYLSGWGGAGNGNGEFSNPEWVATDSSGNVFVADVGNDRIQKFDASGNYLGKWGSTGYGNGQFQDIGGVAIGPGGDVYVSDSSVNRVQKFTNAGAYIRQWGTSGSGDGQFNSPGPLATDSSGNVYVTDYNNARVQKFTGNGGFLTKWGSSGSGPGQFNGPGGIALDSSGNVYVIDIYDYRVEKFTGSGAFVTQWGSNGSGDGQFTAPSGIAVDSSGNVYVSDRNTSRIQAFSPQGTFLFKWGTAGGAPGEIDDPDGLAFGAGGDLYEADFYNARIQRFQTLDCTPIDAAIGPTYKVTPADLGKTIRVQVTAANGVSPAGVALSAPTEPVAPAPPPPPAAYVLSVAKSVSDTGTGTVTSDPAGIDCGTICQKTYDPGAAVTLNARANLGSKFTGWTGDCTNQTGPCEVTMNGVKTVTARFTAADTYRLTVAKQGNGQGTVTSTPAGIDCGATCESSFNDGEEVTLTASASGGSGFTGWSGACTGTAPCQVTMDQARQVTATFDQAIPSYALSVTKQGNGQGTVTSNPSGINCGTACQASYEGGTEVTLTASASQGSTFTGWSGGCTGIGTCQVTMSQAREVTATFGAAMSDVKIKLNTSKLAKVPSNRVVKAVKVSCLGDAPCRIDRAKAKAKAGGGSEQKAPASISSEPFTAGASRMIEVTIPKSVYKKLKKGKKSGLLTVEVRAQGTEGPRDKTIKVGLKR